jgi:hypothetical protein
VPRKTPEQRKLEEQNRKLRADLKKALETKANFNKRIRAEGRWDEFQARAIKVRDESDGKLTLDQAKDRLRPHYPPLKGIQPIVAPDLSPVCLEWDDESDEGTFYDVVDWVMAALGQSDAGAQVKAAKAPGPRSWGLFSWARNNRKDFNALYAREAVRQSTLSAENEVGARRTKYAVEEINEMLDELRSKVA